MSSGDARGATEAEIEEAYKEDRARTRGLCVGPCVKRWIDTGRGVPRYGEPVCCPRCISTVRRQLEELDSAAAIAAAAADGHRSSTGSDDSAIRMHRGGSSSKSGSPLHDTLDELEDCLRAWMAFRRPRAARLGFLARSITESSSWILFNLPSFTDDREIAARFLDEIGRWHQRLVKRGKAGLSLVNKPVPCPRCQQMSLVQDRDSDIVKCTECGRRMAIREYDDLAADGAELTEAGARPSPPVRGKRRSA